MAKSNEGEDFRRLQELGFKFEDKEFEEDDGFNAQPGSSGLIDGERGRQEMGLDEEEPTGDDLHLDEELGAENSLDDSGDDDELNELAVLSTNNESVVSEFSNQAAISSVEESARLKHEDDGTP